MRGSSVYISELPSRESVRAIMSPFGDHAPQIQPRVSRQELSRPDAMSTSYRSGFRRL